MMLADDKTRTLWLVIRQALLLAVDGIERYLGLSPRTSELKAQNRKQERQP